MIAILACIYMFLIFLRVMFYISASFPEAKKSPLYRRNRTFILSLTHWFYESFISLANGSSYDIYDLINQSFPWSDVQFIDIFLCYLLACYSVWYCFLNGNILTVESTCPNKRQVEYVPGKGGTMMLQNSSFSERKVQLDVRIWYSEKTKYQR